MPRAKPIRRLLPAAAPVLAVLCIVGLDRVAAARPWPIPVIGLLDEPAHILTAWLVLNAVARKRRRSWPWVLLGAVAIDVDHIAGYVWFNPVGDGRPGTHSLVTVLALLAVAFAVRQARAVLGGLAAGVLLHFLRDVATGPGVPLFWPVESDSVRLPYGVYLLVLIALAAIPTAKQLRTRIMRRRQRSPLPVPLGQCG